MTHVLLIDGNNLGYASMYIPALMRLSHNGQQTGGMMGLVQSVIRVSGLYPSAIPVVLWDGHAQWRKDIHPEYKANRRDDPEKIAIADSWQQQQPWANSLLAMMGVIQCRSSEAEADDLVGHIVERLSEAPEDTRITMISGDTDWWQAIRYNVDWFTSITDKSMNLEKLNTEEAKDGPFESPDEYLLAKCMAGDHSDNIDGVSGVGIKTAIKLLRQHGGLEGISEAVLTGKAKDKKSIAIHEARSLIARNQSIMDWRCSPELNPYSFGIYRQEPDFNGLVAQCQEFGLDKLAKRLSEESEWASHLEEQSGGDLAAAVDLCDFSVGNIFSY